MVVPHWNRVGSQEPTQPVNNEYSSTDLFQRESENLEDRRVRITTHHEGRVSYTENGYTSYDMSIVLDYAVEAGYLGQTDRLAGNLPTDEVLRQWAQEMFEDDWEIHDFENYETHDDYEQENSYLEEVEII